MSRRLIFGAIAGCVAWAALHPLLALLPASLRFGIGWFLFTIGPGLALGSRLTRGLDALQRTIVELGFGSAALPILVELLGLLGGLAAFPYIALALGGAGLVVRAEESSRGAHVAARSAPKVARRDLGACLLIVALAIGTGSIVFAHRLMATPAGIQLYGDYDSFDLSHYAAWASDATHTVPPRASFYSGHRLNAAYYPQMVLTMVHRFLGVGLLPIYFGYGWPVFLALGGLTAYALVRLLAPGGTALLAVVLLMIGSDFSYLAAWLLPHKTIQWDYVLWPTNFLSPTMEVLHFNTWGPSMSIFFTALYALVQNIRTEKRGWLVAGALVTAVLFQFKPFAYIVVVAGLCGAFVFAGRDWALRWRLFATLAMTGVFTLPLLYPILTLPAEDKRSRLLVDFFLLPQRMLIKLDLTDAFMRFAARVSPAAALQRPIFLLSATVLFLLAGLGIRWFGIAGVWRALRGRAASDAGAWRILAWVVVAGLAIPFVLVTDPYVDTLQFYQVALYVLWIFAAAGLASFARSHKAAGAFAIALAIVASTPSSLHYLARKWTDNERPAVADLSGSELNIAAFLRTQDPETTVILHDSPTTPSLVAIESDRRVVLGWGRAYYAVGSEERVRDIDRFFLSAGGNSDAAMQTLRKYHVTHVVVRADRDRVHPDVLARLKPVMTFPDAALYVVPSE